MKKPDRSYPFIQQTIGFCRTFTRFPQAGPIEPLLKGYDCEFRSLVVEKHYKLIYTVTDELIEIHAVWDCRQEGWHLQEMFK